MRKIIIILLSLIILVPMSKDILAKDKIPLHIEKRQINNDTIKGEYPVYTNKKNEKFASIVNDKINQAIRENTPKKIGKESVRVSYDIIQDGNIYSIMLYFKNVFTEKETVNSINMNIKFNTFVNINSIFGANGINYANKVVANKVSNMEIGYEKVTENSAFYVKNQNVYIVYGAGSITFLQKGNIIIEVPKGGIKSYTLKPQNYYKKSKYNVKMVPLRETLQYFKYKMSWSPESNSISVYKDNEFISYLVVGQNKYSNGINRFIKQLEFAPEMKDGTTYVPISYFSQVLNMIFAVDKYNNIVISEYKL